VEAPSPAEPRSNHGALGLAGDHAGRHRPTMSVVTPPRYNVLGVGVSALTLASARDHVLGVRGELRRGYICLGTAHGLTEARRDPELRAIYNASWLTTPDGMPLVWLGPPGVERVYGPDLMLTVCDAGRATGLRHYLCGGVPGVAETLQDRLRIRFRAWKSSALTRLRSVPCPKRSRPPWPLTFRERGLMSSGWGSVHPSRKRSWRVTGARSMPVC